MRLHHALAPLVTAALFAPAGSFAQGPASIVGNWRSDPYEVPNWNITASIDLTVSELMADQRVSGSFVIRTVGSGGSGLTCMTGPVSGHFDGVALKLASKATNLCSERVWDMKLADNRLSGTYRGGAGEAAVVFRRR